MRLAAAGSLATIAIKLCCLRLTEGTSLLLHVRVELAFKTIQPSDHPVHVVVHIALRDVLLGDLLSRTVEKNLNTLYFLCVRLDHPQDDRRQEGQDDVPYQQFHARRLLLILEFGSFAVFSLVNFFFIPFIRAQKESRRGPPSG